MQTHGKIKFNKDPPVEAVLAPIGVLSILVADKVVNAPGTHMDKQVKATSNGQTQTLTSRGSVGSDWSTVHTGR